MDARIKPLRAKAKFLSPVLQLGKGGLQQGNIDLINRELEQNHLIKIRVLRAGLPDDASKADRRALAMQVAAATNALLVEQVGNIIVLYKP